MQNLTINVFTFRNDMVPITWPMPDNVVDAMVYSRKMPKINFLAKVTIIIIMFLDRL